jgi:hypothetical protein
MRRYPVIFSLALVVLSTSGCADDNNTEVTDIYTANSTMEVEEPAIFQIEFDYNSEKVFNDGDTVSLVVKIPAQLSYLRNSAELNQWGGDDMMATPFVRTCLDGTTYLAFVFDDNDLDDSQSSNDSDAELSITLVAKRQGTEIPVEATAAIESVPYGCREDFVADEQELVEIEGPVF